MGHDGGVADQLPPSTFVVVSGAPASGKTTLARAIAPALGLPLVAKDTIKEALMSVLPVPDVEASRAIGTASVAALLAVAAETSGAVLESVWHRSRSGPDLQRLPGNIVEVFCRCDPRIARRRYAERTPAELWNDEVARPVAGGWPVIEICTNDPVDVAPLTARIRAAAGMAA